MQTSKKGHDADSDDDRKLAFSSRFYMHTIGQTDFVETTGANEKVNHFFGYIPIIFSYTEDVNNAGEYRWAGFSALTGADINTIQLSNLSGRDIRYYALFQPI